MPAPGAGELNQKITIQKNQITKGGLGGKVKTWSVWLEKVSAKKVNLSGNEREATALGGVVGEARSVFTIRYRPGLTTTDYRILHKGLIYNLKHINNFEEKSRWLVITCDTGGTNG
ncbi:head-tail adaptor protein [Methylophilus sp. Leaf414]|uniref:head-tail adaptor protein n=1 Tax=Methylophilus sp. Leaf414 TaxID=1736371 RepID=UPI0006F60F99|nr:head-tail adaptor protein [Methylophilus sp. Leaf414]KQT37681.1 hypothetical protein ASG24_01410 [Methylophilus sp. Leaf414]